MPTFHVCKLNFLITWELFVWFLHPWKERKKDVLGRCCFLCSCCWQVWSFKTLTRKPISFFTFLSPYLEFFSSTFPSQLPSSPVPLHLCWWVSQYLRGPFLTPPSLQFPVYVSWFLCNVRKAHFLDFHDQPGSWLKVEIMYDLLLFPWWLFLFLVHNRYPEYSCRPSE